MHRARSARRSALGRTLRCGLFLVLPHRAVSLVPVVPPPGSVGSVVASLPEVWSAYESALAVYPLETKVATAAVLAVAGDAIAQRRGGDKYDVTRACSFVLFDAAYRGGFQHAAFPWIIEHCQGDVLGRLVSSSAVDPALLAAIECTAFNQLLVVPIVYYPLFFGITGAVQGLSLAESLTRARQQFVDLTIRNWKFWIPAQLAQFYLLPIDLQVPFTCVMGLVWNVILSAVAGAARPAIAEGVATGPAPAVEQLEGRVVPSKTAAGVGQKKEL